MSEKQTVVIASVGILVLLIAATATGCFVTGRGDNGPVMLGLITATSVGIERIIETFWSIVGQLRNSWWPLTVPVQCLDDYMGRLNTDVRPFVDEVARRIAVAKGTADHLPEATKRIEDVAEQLSAYLLHMSVASPPTQDEAAVMIAAIDSLRKQCPGVDEAAARAKILIANLSSFADSFQENPARKLISLYAGSFLGIVVAAVAGMDLFLASGIAKTTLLGFHWGVVATGLVMGLGSNPAHEVIKAVQEFKGSQRAQAAR